MANKKGGTPREELCRLCTSDIFLLERVLFERRELVTRDNVVATHGIGPPICVGMLMTIESR